MFGGDLLADVLHRGDGLAGAIVDWLSTGVDAGEIAGVRDCLGPREKIAGLIRVEAAALLLIEINDGVVGEVFTACGGNRGCGIFCPERGRRGAGSLCLFYLGVEFAVRENKEPEVIVEESIAFAPPAVLVLSGRIGEPVAGKGKVPSQCRQGVVAGVVVAVESDGILCRPGRSVADGRRRGWLGAASGGQEKESGERSRQESHKKVRDSQRNLNTE
jgi:hypothetical protein